MTALTHLNLSHQPVHDLNPLPAEQETTRRINIHRHDFDLPNGRRFRLNVLDFGGRETYHASHQFFLTRRSLYGPVDVFGGGSPLLVFQNEKGGRSATPTSSPNCWR